MSIKTRSGWVPRYGKGRIINMLVGSRSKEILDNRLDELSTYGLLKEAGVAYLQDLFRMLEGEGLLTTSQGDYPIITLTPKGTAVMSGDSNFALRWPQRKLHRVGVRTGVSPRGKEGSSSLPDLEEMGFDSELFEKLRQKRSEIANEEGVPPFVIFANATLEFFTRLRPTSFEAGQSIRGVGKVKAERYLAEFISVIRDHGS